MSDEQVQAEAWRGIFTERRVEAHPYMPVCLICGAVVFPEATRVHFDWHRETRSSITMASLMGGR